MSATDQDSAALRYEGECIWCEQTGTIKGHEVYSNFIAAGPSGPLHIPYDKVCVSCWDDIREQWEQNGELSKPLTAFGTVDQGDSR